jgi:hypothetical protein
MSNTTSPNKHRALAALNSLLMQVSAITLKDLGVALPVLPGREFDILAHVEVFGRTHTLACRISGSDPQQVRAALEELRDDIAGLPGKVTPVLIFPVLSPEVQALCDESKTAFLDLHGNGRLAIDEVFISMRSLPRRALHRPVSASAPSIRVLAPAAEEGSGQRVMRGFPPVEAPSPIRVSPSARHGRPR